MAQAAEKALDRLRAIADAPNADEYRVGATPASAVLKLASHGLEGELLMASGDLPGAIDAFLAGVVIEDQNNYSYASFGWITIRKLSIECN